MMVTIISQVCLVWTAHRACEAPSDPAATPGLRDPRASAACPGLTGSRARPGRRETPGYPVVDTPGLRASLECRGTRDK